MHALLSPRSLIYSRSIPVFISLSNTTSICLNIQGRFVPSPCVIRLLGALLSLGIGDNCRDELLIGDWFLGQLSRMIVSRKTLELFWLITQSRKRHFAFTSMPRAWFLCRLTWNKTDSQSKWIFSLFSLFSLFFFLALFISSRRLELIRFCVCVCMCMCICVFASAVYKISICFVLFHSVLSLVFSSWEIKFEYINESNLVDHTGNIYLLMENVSQRFDHGFWSLSSELKLLHII